MDSEAETEKRDLQDACTNSQDGKVTRLQERHLKYNHNVAGSRRYKSFCLSVWVSGPSKALIVARSVQSGNGFGVSRLCLIPVRARRSENASFGPSGRTTQSPRKFYGSTSWLWAPPIGDFYRGPLEHLVASRLACYSHCRAERSLAGKDQGRGNARCIVDRSPICRV